jgi:hypothetical protein
MGRSFPEVKRPGHVVDHISPSSTEVKERIVLYLYSSKWAFVACSRVNFNILPIFLVLKSLGLKISMVKCQGWKRT